MKTIYLLLTRSQTCLSRTIHALTGDSYTHVSVAFDEALTTLCSFARYDARFPLPAGLVREQPTAGYYGAHPQIPCALVAVEVSEAGYARARGRAEAMLAATPAGASDMALISADLGIRNAKLIVLQVLRLITVVLVFPSILSVVVGLFG